jgi:hypothetical protein
MFINVSDSLSRIYGYSLSVKGGILTILSNFDSPSRTRTDYIKIPAFETWAGMEQTTDGSLLIVSVQSRQPGQPHFLKMIAYDARGNKLISVAKKTFNSPQFSKVQFMRKVKGYDYFVVACKNSLAIFCFTGKEFVLLNFLENLYRELIFEVCLHGNYMVPVSSGSDEPVKLIEFNRDSYLSLVRSDAFKQNNVRNNKNTLMEGVFVNQKVKKLKVPDMSMVFVDFA